MEKYEWVEDAPPDILNPSITGTALRPGQFIPWEGTISKISEGVRGC
jgi:hypothetical protein